MIFSEQDRSKRKSLRRSHMRRRARSGFAYLSGFVVLSLAVMSLVLANLSSRHDARPGYVSTYSQPQPGVYKKDKEQRILDQTLAKLETLKTSVVEEEYDISDSEIDYSVAATEPEHEPIIAENELDQADPAEENTEPSVPAYPGSAPKSAAPAGPYFPQVAGSPTTPYSGSPFGRSSTPQRSTPGAGGGGGGGGAPGAAPSSPLITSNGPSTGPGYNPPPVTDTTPGGQPSGPEIVDNQNTPPPASDNTPSDGNPYHPPVLDGPLLGDNSDPTDGWFSPGHSPGIATVAGNFNLDGQTLLFEILGTEPGSGYDQLQVEGIADLDEGNVVFAFINGYVPAASDLYDLILGQQILVDLAKVNFYYGLFDPAGGNDAYELHAPLDLSLYTALNYKDGNPDDVTLTLHETGNGSASNDSGVLSFNQLMRIAYADLQGSKNPGPEQTFKPIEFPAPDNGNPSPTATANTVPEPAPLLLLASGLGLVLLRRFGKDKTGK